MNPAYPTDNHPSETVPMQGTMHPGQHQSNTVVQYTTVNVSSETPKDHIIWSLWSFVYGNFCCLGLAALIFSIKARDRKMVGDLNGAKHYGATARCLNICTTVLFSITIFSILVSVIMIATSSVTYAKSYYYYNYN